MSYRDAVLILKKTLKGTFHSFIMEFQVDITRKSHLMGEEKNTEKRVFFHSHSMLFDAPSFLKVEAKT